jgi:hypothetical protein
MSSLGRLVIVVILLSLNAVTVEHPSKAQQQAEAELLAIHAQDRRAHMTRDVKLLLEHAGDSLLDVRDGKVRTLTREQMRARFTDYFRRAEFSAWDDVEPAVVHASDDGSMGWMVVRVHIVYAEPNGAGKQLQHDETMAWMAAYEKRDGRWIMTAVTSTSEEGQSRREGNNDGR